MDVDKEQVPPNPTVDDGGTDAITVAEDDATPVVMDASETADTVLHTAQTLLDIMDINDNINEVENAIGGGDTTPNTSETNDTIMLEDNLNTNPLAETSV